MKTPSRGEQLPLSGSEGLALIEAQFLLLASGAHWYTTSVLFRLLVVANLIIVLSAVVVVLVAALVFSLPWGMPESAFRPKAKRPN